MFKQKQIFGNVFFTLSMLLHFIVVAQIPVPGKENVADQPSASAAQPGKEMQTIVENSSKESSTPVDSLDQRRPPLTNLQKLSRFHDHHFASWQCLCTELS